MRYVLLTVPAVAFLAIALTAQVRYTGAEFEDYYRWFHQYSQTADFYTEGATLYVFTDQAPLHQRASAQAPTLLRLQLAQSLTNHVIAVEDMTESTLRGYSEAWFRVSACSPEGESITGYVWGGHLAKAWRHLPTGLPGQPDMVMLGLTQDERQRPEDIRACVRLLRQGQVLQSTDLPKLCVFEECGSSTLLRVLFPGAQEGVSPMIIEVSVLTSSCDTGVDKSLVAWDGHSLERVYQAEYVTGYTYHNRPLNWGETRICRYDGEDGDFNPVWACQDVVVSP
ncbi:MAG: hypothetical protein KDC54_08960 [Lewinella sp.]|nr:hypothetical protein [Lewinella sp.]